MEFLDAWNKTMGWEGGAKLHLVPDDPGGATKYGLSQRAYPELDIPNVTRTEAQTITKMDYWDALQCEALPHMVRWHVFDFAFNAGPQRAAVTLQKAINMSLKVLGVAESHEDFLKEDGVIGVKTIRAANMVSQLTLLEVFRTYRAGFYLLLVEKHKASPRFLRGWLRRAQGGENA